MLRRVENRAKKGPPGGTAGTRGIREELRDSLKKWFQDKQQPSHNETGGGGGEERNLAAFETLGGLLPSFMVF